MKKKKKIALIVIPVVFIVLIAGLFIAMNNMGKVKVRDFEKIGDDIYAISEGINQANIYLVIGDEKAALIDTGNGLTDLPESVREITDLPVIVINTHGHYDHMWGNHYFDEVYLPEKDKETFEYYTDFKNIERVVKDDLPGPLQFFMKYYFETIEETPIKYDLHYFSGEGSFDLGNRKLTIIEIPGHTPGIVGLLDENTGALFCGDAITSTGLLLGLPESLSVSIQLETLDKVQELVDNGSVLTMYSGHGAFEMDTEIINKFKSALNKIKSLDLTDEEKQAGRIDYEGLNITFKLDNLD